jgi:hypothetical protein
MMEEQLGETAPDRMWFPRPTSTGIFFRTIVSTTFTVYRPESRLVNSAGWMLELMQLYFGYPGT